MVKPVAIIGSHPTFGKAPKDDTEVWKFNTFAMTKPCSTAFQMHKPSGYLCQSDEYLNWLSNLTMPVYMKERREEYPTSLTYPFEDAFALTNHVLLGDEPLKFFTSSVSEAIALAVLQDRPRIDIYGVEMALQTEYEQQRECYAFWVGYAAGRGIPLNIHGSHQVFRRPIYE